MMNMESNRPITEQGANALKNLAESIEESGKKYVCIVRGIGGRAALSLQVHRDGV